MKKIVTLSLLLAVSIAMTAGVALANYGDDNNLSGHVRKNKTTKSINKAKVKLYKKNGRLKDTDKTGKDGKYSFSDLTEGTYKVTASASGYRNPRNAKKDSVSETVKVDGDEKQNLYLKLKKI